IDQPFELPTTPAPHYPFERQSYWVPARPAASSAPAPAGMLGQPVEIATGGTAWTSRLAPDRPAFLGEHVVGDAVIVPGASHVAMLLGACGAAPAALADIAFVAPLALSDDGREVQVLRDGDTLSLFARGDDGAWVLHARAATAPDRPAGSADLAAVLARCAPDEAGPEALYAMLDERGIHLSQAFRGIRRLWRGEGEAVAEIELMPGLARDCPELPIHPAALDACFQTLGATFSGGGASGAFLPFAIERVAFLARCPERFRVHVQARPGTGTLDAAQGDLRLFDEAGRTVARIDGLSIARLRGDAKPAPLGEGWSYRIDWQPWPLPAAATSPEPAVLAGRVRAAAVAATTELATPPELGAGLERLAAAYAAAAVRAVDPSEVDPKRRRLFVHLPGMAAHAPPEADPESLRTALEDRFGAMPEIGIAARCGRALPAVLRGEQDPLAVLFSDGEAGFLYGGAGFARLLNGMVLAAIEGVAQAADPARPVRILEIGAGTGALLDALRARVPAGRFRYDFTDISPAFLSQAAERFGAEAARFVPLDIERDPAAQDFLPDSYDLVVAGNVLHATRDLAASLAHAQSLLAPGGILLLLEAARRSAWSDLVFGLTDGWWRFEDTWLRPDHPLLDAAGWRRLLAERFGSAELVASPGSGDQIVAIARNGATDQPIQVLRPLPGASALDLSAEILAAARRALESPRPPALRIVLPRGLAPLDGPPDPAMASAAGLARVLTLEHPELDCRILDSDEELPEAELAAGDEVEVAWRGGRRFVRRVLPLTLPADAGFRTTGTHLVTGGLGGLGRGLADWLLAHGAERVLLLARHAATDPLPPGIELLQADVADRTAMTAAIAAAGPGLRGVFHLAGSLDDGVFLRLDRDRLERVYRAKIEGARLLDELTAHLPLDAFVLFGSTAGVFGNPGQANHAGANAFLDALAWQRRARGLPALAIDWGAWAGAGAIAREGVAGRFAGEGVGLMDPQAAFDLMGRAIAAGETQIIGAMVDWPVFLRRYGQGRVPAFFDAVRPGTRRSPAAAPPAASGSAAGRPADHASLARFVAARAAAVMGSAAGETIPDDQPLNELGLDSLMALELRKALGQGLGLELPATLLFSYPTILALTEHLAGLLGLAEEPGAAGELPPEVKVDEDLAAVQAMSEAEMTALIEREFALAVADHG
ncbi:KR domain-containing protein, partial [Geminicoccus harenae]|uniref:KR domain-containing protein n=2 Tax=Geminicoccus harenae TaxID=2498453 RepID=UPI001C9846F7